MSVYSYSTTAVPSMQQDDARIVADPGVLGGMPVVAGTRVPAATILAYLREGRTEDYIREDYPTLPAGAIEAVRRWDREMREGA